DYYCWLYYSDAHVF
nr:immunoglobulin light chain junction region [Macaca mulatta]